MLRKDCKAYRLLIILKTAVLNADEDTQRQFLEQLEEYVDERPPRIWYEVTERGIRRLT